MFDECFRNRELAAKVLLPLIEFEFGLIADDKPPLVQSKDNLKQIRKVFEICKRHGWTTSKHISYKGGNPYFRINMAGFREIYKIAGPFADAKKDRWAQLLLERSGKKGGYRGDKLSTEERLMAVFKRCPDEKWKIEELCLELRLLPGTVRAALRNLEKLQIIRKIRFGRSYLYMLAAV